jgi:hypothetical protein
VGLRLNVGKYHIRAHCAVLLGRQVTPRLQIIFKVGGCCVRQGRRHEHTCPHPRAALIVDQLSTQNYVFRCELQNVTSKCRHLESILPILQLQFWFSPD